MVGSIWVCNLKPAKMYIFRIFSIQFFIYIYTIQSTMIVYRNCHKKMKHQSKFLKLTKQLHVKPDKNLFKK